MSFGNRHHSFESFVKRDSRIRQLEVRAVHVHPSALKFCMKCLRHWLCIIWGRLPPPSLSAFNAWAFRMWHQSRLTAGCSTESYTALIDVYPCATTTSWRCFNSDANPYAQRQATKWPYQHRPKGSIFLALAREQFVPIDNNEFIVYFVTLFTTSLKWFECNLFDLGGFVFRLLWLWAGEEVAKSMVQSTLHLSTLVTLMQVALTYQDRVRVSSTPKSSWRNPSWKAYRTFQLESISFLLL